MVKLRRTPLLPVTPTAVERTDIRDAHDKYANQEVAYLLQRIESYNGLVILASNQRANIDDAFIRRLQSIIHFPLPRSEERYEIC
jgi:SpoVK/Ycf46/Vps4 family AAA+-type ATPase